MQDQRSPHGLTKLLLPAATPFTYIGRIWKKTGKTLRAAIALLLLLTVGGTGYFFYKAGPLNPLPWTQVLAELPAPNFPNTYTRLTTDKQGWLWVAQSRSGLLQNPSDPTQITVISPAGLFSQPIMAKLCLGCSRRSNVPDIVKIDDIAGDPLADHSAYISGWTAEGTPVVVLAKLPQDLSVCRQRPDCATISVIWDTTTLVQSPWSSQTAATLQLLQTAGIKGYMALTTAANGDLYCFISDRGLPSLQDPTANLVGGYQGLFELRQSDLQWRQLYNGPAGTYALQQQSPTSSISSIALSANEKTLYLADTDHFELYSVNMQDPDLSSSNPYIAAKAFTLLAGTPAQTSQTMGADAIQGVPGWLGDGQNADTAHIGVIRDIAADASGNLLLADSLLSRIRIIERSGTMMTLAGSGAATVQIGSAPAENGLLGITAIAAGPASSVYTLQGGAIDTNGKILLTQIHWGWLGENKYLAKATTPGNATIAAATAGMFSHGAEYTGVIVSRSVTCDAAASNCQRAYIIHGGEWGVGQSYLTNPSTISSLYSSGNIPNTVGAIPTALIIPGQGMQIADTIYNSASQPLALPNGASPIAAVTSQPLPGSALIYTFVAARTSAGQIWLYALKTPATTCGLQQTAANCAQFGAPPELAASMQLAGVYSAQNITFALSADGQRGIVVIADSQGNQLAIINVSQLISQGGPMLFSGTAAVNNPISVAVRSDGAAIYAGTGSGQIVTLTGAQWLNGNTPIAQNITQTETQTHGAVTALLISGDNSQMFALETGAHGASLAEHYTIGAYGAAATPQLQGATALAKNTMAIALSPSEQLFITLASPNGASALGTLTTYRARAEFNPAVWLPAPQYAGAAQTPAYSAAITSVYSFSGNELP